MVEKKFLETVKKFRLIEPEDKILVAFSSGVDSVILTTLLLKFKEYLHISTIAIAHLNHMLRGESSDLDEQFAIDFAQKNKLEIFVKRVDIKKLAKEEKASIEEIARNERYKFFREILQEKEFNKIATGHHLSDLIETMLLWFIQGNRKGIKGFKPREKDIIRPLFTITKDELLQYAHKNSIEYRIDESNFETDYLRNKLRIHIIPLLKQINPSLEKSMLTEAFLLQYDDDFLDGYATEISQKFPNTSIQLSQLLNLPEAIIYRVLINWIYKNTGVYPSYSLVLDIMELLHKEGEKSFDIGDGFVLIKTYDRLLIKEKSKKISFEYRIKVGEEAFIKEAGIKLKSYFTDKVDIEKLKDEKKIACFEIDDFNPEEYFIIRSRREGDRFLPFGKKTEKKLKDILIDLKVPKHMRDSIPILEFRNKILWIVNLKRSGYYPIKTETGKKICFEIEEV